MTEKPKAKEAPKKQPPEKPEKKQVVALTADFGTVYIRADKSGAIMRPIKADISLFEKMGHLYTLPAGGKKKRGQKFEDEEPEGASAQDRIRDFIISSAGYTQLNKVAGISILTPQAVIVDGKDRPNPFIERDPETKAITAVNLRKIGIGYSPAGTLVAVDKTLFYNIYTYFIQSIQAKMKRVQWKDGHPTDQKQFPNCAVYGTKDQAPAKKEGAWAFFPTQPPLGLWINYQDQATIDCMEEHTQRQRFGDRIAQTIVDRNILKDHPAIGVARVFAKEGQQGWVATVTVWGYRHDTTPSDLGRLLQEAEKGMEGTEIEKKTAMISGIDETEEKVALEDAAEFSKTDEVQTETPDEDEEQQTLFKGADKK